MLERIGAELEFQPEKGQAGGMPIPSPTYMGMLVGGYLRTRPSNTLSVHVPTTVVGCWELCAAMTVFVFRASVGIQTNARNI